MSQDEIFEQVVKILTPYVKNQEALDGVSMSTHILDELKVNSARLVDIRRSRITVPSSATIRIWLRRRCRSMAPYSMAGCSFAP